MNTHTRPRRFGEALRLLALGTCLSVAAFAQVRINSGGGASGTFAADAQFTGGNVATTAAAIDTSTVASPAPQTVYQSERWGDCTYTITGLSTGAVYTARLHFAEIYFTAAGQRQFNVSVNGTPVLNNFDIVAAAGGANKGIVKEFTATAAGGQVVIALTTGAANNPKISGIEILGGTLPPPSTSINAGGGATGTFAADAYYTGGNVATTAAAITTSSVSSPAPQAVYQSERWGACTYTFTGLTAGTAYTARLHFAEIYWTAAGQRKFNASINGTQVLNNFDIFATAGAANKAVVQEFPATVSASGQIIIAFSAGTADQPKISGIELTSGFAYNLSVSPLTFSFLSVDGIKSAAITSNTAWTAKSDQTWLTVTPASGSGNGTLSLSAANNTGVARNAVVTVTGGGITKQILVSQNAGETLSVSPTTLAVAQSGGTSPVTLTSNTSWTASSNQTWLTLTPASGTGNGALSLTASSNTTTVSRTAVVTVKTSTLTSTITVTQPGQTQTTGPDWNNPMTITADWMVYYMGRGTNLGNTYDVEQNPKDFNSVKAVMDAFIAAGLTNVRIPVKWDYRVDAYGNVGIDANGNPTNGDILNMKLLVDYVTKTVNPLRLSQGKTPIILMVNTHHEDWAMNDLIGSANYEKNMARLETIWKGICTIFKDAPDSLTFEFFNEPHAAMDTGDAAVNSVVEMNKRIYNVIRNYTVDGKKPHQYRKLVFGGINWNSTWGLWYTYSSKDRLPGGGSDKYIIGTYHFYNDINGANGDFDNIVNNFQKPYGIPVHMGEFGTDHRNGVTATDQSYYWNAGNWAVARNFAISVWDDNGWFQVYNRTTKTWTSLLASTLGDRSIPKPPAVIPVDPIAIPGQLEAESFTANFGVQTETCTEGGLNVGYMDSGDWMDYDVNVLTTGTYTIECRVAGYNPIGTFKVGTTTVTPTNTGGWQNWATITATVNLTAGRQTLRIASAGSAFNINWIKFTLK
jgi:endoglucanase